MTTVYQDYRRHGGPFDRGAADSWYDRAPVPHFFKGATYSSEKVEEKDMTAEEIAAYWEGYKENESIPGAKKDWN